ncbi:MAG: helix-turn-helix domain-containing protein [Sphaerochaeta sp.]
MNKNRNYAFDPDYAVPPGRTLEEVIESLGMTQKELAIRTGLTEQSIIRILNGEQPITYDTATKLEMVTAVPARMWNNLEMQYREQLSKLKFKQQLQEHDTWLKDLPLYDLKKRRILPETENRSEMVQEALKFYGVSSVEAWKELWCNPKVAARRSSCFESLPGPASAWIRLGELQAQQIECAPFNASKFTEALQTIRSMTTKKPEEFIPSMRTLTSEAGVVLALVPKCKKVPWNGASKWLSPEKALLVLNLRGKGEDIFWFSFFHEAYHILQGKKKQLYIADDSSTDPEEKKADAFAANMLIPNTYNQRIASITTKAEVIAIANELEVSPGIVAGRYRHLTKRWSFFKDLTKSFSWEEKGELNAGT